MTVYSLHMAWAGILGISVLTALIVTIAATVDPLPQAEASEPLLGTVSFFAGNFAPRGWAFCDGQLLPIAQNTALFSILGTTYGGDGRTTFGIPDMRGRSWVHDGQGPGLTPVRLGERGGSETVILVTANMPAHTHVLKAVDAVGDTASAAGTALSLSFARHYSTAEPITPMHSDSIMSAGSSTAFSIDDPYVVMNCIIALTGVFPSRS